MPPPPTDHAAALASFRTAMLKHPKAGTVISTGLGKDPHDATAEQGICVLYNMADADAPKAIAEVARTAAPGVKVFLLPSGQPRPQAGGPG